MPSRRECANALRILAVDAIEQARSGHPGAPLGMADMAESLWRNFLKFNPKNPQWHDRDRFILSNGHASMLLYALLHLTGYDLSMQDIKDFRQMQSKTPGHPERGVTPGVEMSTGPLGQGIASAVGVALAEAMLAAQFNRPGYPIVNHYTYAFCGDGCLMEGVSHEACALAGSWKLEKLIVLYDSNGVSIDGKIDPWFSDDVAARYAGYGWRIIGPVDGHDNQAIDQALEEARTTCGRPTLIICKTHIGYGSPKTDTSASHGAPLGPEAVQATRTALGWSFAPFEIPTEIYSDWDATKKGEQVQKEWDELFARYSAEYPELAREFLRRMSGELPVFWPEVSRELNALASTSKASEATRADSRRCLEVLVARLPELVGGSADLSGSVGTQVPDSVPLDPETYSGNYLFYGVREFGMGAIINGLAMHGGFIPYAGTFLSFSDQAKNAMRLSALMRLRVIWVLTHDSIGVGEDGPTHQPVEQIATLRLVPRLLVWRPCDQLETTQAWISALEMQDSPSCLILSRQKLPELPDSGERRLGAARGGYVLKDCDSKPDIILIATGSEVHLAVEAAERLAASGVNCRVVSMPCTELFDAQDQAWRDAVLPPDVKLRIAVEAASTDLWWKYTGLDGAVIGVDTFGLSAPGAQLFDYFGISAENIANQARKLLAAARH